ncbi:MULTISPECIES: DUF1349 domain-containing protein [unclassified Frondihabitans]|uniref:DUF1349 domain-containing protein n=1 Tax=unclassified Frondihabitans TaxID=2626248 RepID=UPI000F4E102D|nr:MULTISPECIES: DUF1349 domain-containing protein [unclassified Frondihabitans]RPE78362.1 hypothetical protein EDF37_1038 [Frondihabitans sp. PhB153]RPF08643.1 hypothetical protein EDF39_1040 [Frondihabitans sp. PhB161]
MTLSIPGLPPLHWTGAEGRAEVDEAAGTLTLHAEAGVDWTNDAAGGPQQHAATALAFIAPDGDFIVSARVVVEGERSTFDAGAIALWRDRDHWAKVCNELSPRGESMVVSVVTDRYSDDCNSAVFDESGVFLRAARIGSSVAFHSSDDGERWDFVRVFRFAPAAEPLSIGFLAQAPLGDGCWASFSDIVYAETTLTDLRDGR